jgi:hypothetical protein
VQQDALRAHILVARGQQLLIGIDGHLVDYLSATRAKQSLTRPYRRMRDNTDTASGGRR